ncbi:unnamed protein product [Orchesella dallaii]|uniref:Uncharacterized protein n=1 Tax=Orchesella dallaii TaxID=48710 RepID=A0ABP1PTA3_9HEXA
MQNDTHEEGTNERVIFCKHLDCSKFDWKAQPYLCVTCRTRVNREYEQRQQLQAGLRAIKKTRKLQSQSETLQPNLPEQSQILQPAESSSRIILQPNSDPELEQGGATNVNSGTTLMGHASATELATPSAPMQADLEDGKGNESEKSAENPSSPSSLASSPGLEFSSYHPSEATSPTYLQLHQQ